MKDDMSISSHFMYHITEYAVISFLKNNISAIIIAAIFSELKRNGSAMGLFKLSSFLLAEPLFTIYPERKT